MTQKARILLADDHELFRSAIASMINQQADLEVVGQAGDGLEALEMTRDLHPDLVVMDINMPVCDGVEATRLLRQLSPDVIIMILTVQKTDEKLLECLRAGANGYCLKEATSAGFLRALRGMLAGEASLPRELASRLVSEYSRLARQPVTQPVPALPTLTSREVEILKLVARGASNKEIAARLAISIYTVKSHIRTILEKLGVENRWAAVEAARQRGLLPPER